MTWEKPVYKDTPSAQHALDPEDQFYCICGHVFEWVPTTQEWEAHKYGPPRCTPERSGVRSSS